MVFFNENNNRLNSAIRGSNPRSKQVKHFLSVSQEIQATFISEEPNIIPKRIHIIADSLV